LGLNDLSVEGILKYFLPFLSLWLKVLSRSE